jgi:ketosteroid isomerase-like protein
MSQQNVELVRSSFEALARGDFGSAFSSYDPSMEWCTAADEPDQQTHRGIAELEALVESLAEPWVDRFGDTTTFEGFIDGGDWVVVPWSAQVRGRGSGISIEISETYAVRVHNARIVRVEEYRTKEQALAAVGLPG